MVRARVRVLSQLTYDGGFFFSQENENFVEDGIQIEPFNLEKEREEGYFDAEGNFVEYINQNEIKVKQTLSYCLHSCLRLQKHCFQSLCVDGFSAGCVAG
jgi:hypothetical protein